MQPLQEPSLGEGLKLVVVERLNLWENHTLGSQMSDCHKEVAVVERLNVWENHTLGNQMSDCHKEMAVVER